MKFIGPKPRAVALRSAANRLRWEVEFALDSMETRGERPSSMHEAREVTSVVHELAETVGILRQTLETMEQHLPSELAEEARSRFASLSDWYVRYHETPR